jgi:hypothetical protein
MQGPTTFLAIIIPVLVLGLIILSSGASSYSYTTSRQNCNRKHDLEHGRQQKRQKLAPLNTSMTQNTKLRYRSKSGCEESQSMINIKRPLPAHTNPRTSYLRNSCEELMIGLSKYQGWSRTAGFQDIKLENNAERFWIASF